VNEVSITGKEIIKKWLKDNGFDGLYNPDIPCGCKADDLIPGECDITNCKAGYLEEVKNSDNCECGVSFPHWHIIERRKK